MSEPRLRVVVDREKCMGSGDPPEAIRNAAESCPQRAITVTEEEN